MTNHRCADTNKNKDEMKKRRGFGKTVESSFFGISSSSDFDLSQTSLTRIERDYQIE